MKEKRENGKKKKHIFLKILLIFLGVIALFALTAYIYFTVNKNKIVKKKLDNASNIEDYVGRDVPPFDVETPDGTHITADSLLDGKELAAVVLYASWCEPCKKEFPEMDSICQKYGDKMSMVGIDVDVLDDMNAVRQFQETYKLSFPLAFGYKNESLDFVKTTTYPTTLIIDRNGKICFWRVGSIPTAEAFEKIVTVFMGDDYSEKHPAYYSFIAWADGESVPGVEFCITKPDGSTETYVTDEEGSCAVFFEERADMPVEVISVPDGFAVSDDGARTTGLISTLIRLPVEVRK